MTASANCKVASVLESLGFGISEQQRRSAIGRKSRQPLGKCDRWFAADAHFERGSVPDMAAGQRNRRRVERRHAARRFGPAIVIPGKHRGMERDRRQAFERAHLAFVEIGGEHNPADQGRRHHRCCDELTRAAGQHRNAGQPALVQRLPQARRLGRGNLWIDARNPSVGADDEGGRDAQPGGGVAQCRLHGRFVPGRHRGPETEVAREQLGGILEFVRSLLPQAVVDRAARLELALDLARRRAGDERRKRQRHGQHRAREQQSELDRQAGAKGTERPHRSIIRHRHRRRPQAHGKTQIALRRPNRLLHRAAWRAKIGMPHRHPPASTRDVGEHSIPWALVRAVHTLSVTTMNALIAS